MGIERTGGDGNDELRGGGAGDDTLNGGGNGESFLDERLVEFYRVVYPDYTLDEIKSLGVYSRKDGDYLYGGYGGGGRNGEGRDDYGNPIPDDNGSNILNGGAGNDYLYGGAGNDTLQGGKGKDDLWGGGGADRFVFDNESETDYIRDFEDGQDIIVIKGGPEVLRPRHQAKRRLRHDRRSLQHLFDRGQRYRGVAVDRGRFRLPGLTPPANAAPRGVPTTARSGISASAHALSRHTAARLHAGSAGIAKERTRLAVRCWKKHHHLETHTKTLNPCAISLFPVPAATKGHLCIQPGSSGRLEALELEWPVLDRYRRRSRIHANPRSLIP